MSGRTTDPVAALPHAGPARLVTQVLDRRTDEIVCEAKVPEDSPYVRNGRCPTFVALEIAAQSAGLFETLAVGGGDKASGTGYIVRARGMHCVRPEFAAGEALGARTRRITSVAPLFVHEVEVWDGAGPLLRGEIAIYLTTG